ncbi:MAG: CDP-diacylglycerol--serine O-phosphatidyltransferase [Calditrichia bacterium]
MKVKKDWVPSAFTMANIFCGYFSVILSANEKFIQAAWLIVAAAVLDALDGKIARFTKVASPFGVEYDSLADVVSFGLAPSFLAYKAAFSSWGTIGLFISFGPLVFGSVRLARFNVRLQGFDKEYFEGLPTPAAAITLATFLIFNYHFWEHLRWEKVFLFLIILVSVLMVSTIRYETLPTFSLQKESSNRPKIFAFLLGLIAIIFFPQETFFPLAILYVLSGPARVSWLLVSGSGEKTSKDKVEVNEGNHQSAVKKGNPRSSGKGRK